MKKMIYLINRGLLVILFYSKQMWIKFNINKDKIKYSWLAKAIIFIIKAIFKIKAKPYKSQKSINFKTSACTKIFLLVPIKKGMV